MFSKYVSSLVGRCFLYHHSGGFHSPSIKTTPWKMFLDLEFKSMWLLGHSNNSQPFTSTHLSDARTRRWRVRLKSSFPRRESGGYMCWGTVGNFWSTRLQVVRNEKDWIMCVKLQRRRRNVWTSVLRSCRSEKVAARFTSTTKMGAMSPCPFIVMRAKALTLREFVQNCGGWCLCYHFILGTGRCGWCDRSLWDFLESDTLVFQSDFVDLVYVEVYAKTVVFLLS